MMKTVEFFQGFSLLHSMLSHSPRGLKVPVHVLAYSIRDFTFLMLSLILVSSFSSGMMVEPRYLKAFVKCSLEPSGMTRVSGFSLCTLDSLLFLLIIVNGNWDDSACSQYNEIFLKNSLLSPSRKITTYPWA